jgi:DNA-directed RNA polymerase specialized sigma24 family protein
LTAEDFLKRLNPDPAIAREIHDKLTNLVKSLVIKKLKEMGVDFFEDDVQGLINRTFLMVYSSFAKGKPLDFSDPPASIQNYFWRVADALCKEFRRHRYRDASNVSLSHENYDDTEQQFADEKESVLELLTSEQAQKIRSECFRKTLGTLEPGERHILLSYYKIKTKKANEKKRLREELAAELGMQMDGLRVKINRIKQKIGPLFEACLDDKGLGPRPQKKGRMKF